MKYQLLALLTVFASSAALNGQEAPKEEGFILMTLLESSQDEDLEKFESVCDENMRKAMTAEHMKMLSKQVSALMKQGYKKTYMGFLDRGVARTHYWKLDFEKEGASDLLVELSVSGGKAVGFFIR